VVNTWTRRNRPARQRRSKRRSEPIQIAAVVRAGSVVLGAWRVWPWLVTGMDLTLPYRLTGDHLYYVTVREKLHRGHGFRFNEASDIGCAGWDVLPRLDVSHKYILWLEAGSSATDQPDAFLLSRRHPADLHILLLGPRRLEISHWPAALASVAFVVSPILRSAPPGTISSPCTTACRWARHSPCSFARRGAMKRGRIS